MAETPDFEKMAQEAVAGGIGGEGEDPAEAACKIVCKLISHAARNEQDPHQAIVGVCRGGMNGVLLAGKSLPDTAIKVLESLPNMSLIMQTGPEDLMSWVMEGIAEVTPNAGHEVRDAIQARIEEKFMGAGAVFAKLSHAAEQKAQKPASPPAP